MQIFLTEFPRKYKQRCKHGCWYRCFQANPAAAETWYLWWVEGGQRVNQRWRHYSVNCSAVICHHVVFVACGSGCTVCCLCVMPRTWGLAEGQWAERGALWLDGSMPVLVCDSGRKEAWYKAVSLRSLCARTRDSLSFFLQGWGDRGEARRGDGWVTVFCTVSAIFYFIFCNCHVLREELPRSVLGKPLYQNNGGISAVIITDCH